MYGWWRSTLDGQVHAFDLLANLGQPALTAVCGHTVTRDQINEAWQDTHDRCRFDRFCLEALNDGVPQQQLLAELDKARADWRAKRDRTGDHEPDGLLILTRHPA